MPRMGKALRALKTWPEITAEHLEQCHDLGIVLLLLFFCFLFQFFFFLFTSVTQTSFQVPAVLILCLHVNTASVWLVGKSFKWSFYFFFSISKDLTWSSYSAILCPLGQTGGAAMQVVRDRRWPGLSTYSCPGDVESVDLLSMSLFNLF